MTQCVIISLRSGDENKLRHQTDNHRYPNHGTHQVGMTRLHQRESTNGVADAEVTVHTDASEEKDAAVQVRIEKKAHDLTEENAEWPVTAVCVVIYEHGQGEHVQCV